MRITLVHNEYARLSGEDVMIQSMARILSERGHRVSLFLRSSADIDHMSLGHVRAFFSGIHSISAARQLEHQLRCEKPDVVLVQNVYPLISPSAFQAVGRLGIPIVYRCPNYRMFCPNGLLLADGQPCERCVGGHEYWCTLRNCEGSLGKSLGYSLRNSWARLSGAVHRNVTTYIVASEFQKAKFAEWGVPKEGIAVVPNVVDVPAGPAHAQSCGSYVAYVGRVSPEKGVDTLLEAMRQLPDIPCRIAGAAESMPELVRSAPGNVEFVGSVPRGSINAFYAGSRMLVVPSICHETFGLVIAEAMLQGRAVIGSRMGAIPEVIDDGVTGFLFEPGNASSLAEKIRFLWNHPDIANDMGEAGRRKVVTAYSPDAFYSKLMAVLENAVATGRKESAA